MSLESVELEQGMQIGIKIPCKHPWMIPLPPDARDKLRFRHQYQQILLPFNVPELILEVGTASVL
jgi:hypothetical protein